MRVRVYVGGGNGTVEIDLPDTGPSGPIQASDVLYSSEGVWPVPSSPTQVEDAVTRLAAILANSAQVQNGGETAIPTGGTWGVLASIIDFKMTAGGGGFLRVDASAVIKNLDGAASHDVNIGVLAVATGTAPPFVPTYYLSVVTIPLGADGQDIALPFLFDGPPLTPGAGYDLYVLATCNNSAVDLVSTTTVMIAQETL